MYPVILSGGSGSRLWPLSREQFPKQLQALTGTHTLIQDTALRLGPETTPKVAAPIVVCNDAHRFIVAEQLRAVGIEPKAIIIEPEGRNTAPAIAVAAQVVADDPNALLLVMPSDHLIRQPEAFRVAVATAVPLAKDGKLVTFGITPSAASTAYGYVKQGDSLHGGAFEVAAFVEKPDAKTAQSFLDSGDYSWNGGIFLFPAKIFLDELNRFEPDIAPKCQEALDKGSNDLFFFRLDAETFATVPSQSIDYGVMERTDKAAVVQVDMGWSDVGSWSALHDESEQDEDGNTLIGDVVSLDNKNTYVRSERQTTAVVGLEGAIVVVTDDAVLVTDRAHDQKVKDVVTHLRESGNDVATAHAKTYRPWGWFQTVDEGDRFKVKRIGVKPGAKLSLQKHWHRSEHWVVVKGAAQVINGDQEILLGENESTFIPAGTTHRLENPGKVDLEMIEVQSGEYVGEDDIVRLDDDYGREN
ncbi:MAG: mannose-1-phosphate guanylyltransferase/mannose-6-phosphate isomerase [Alphaproteobacteria bacterium]|nr:mannose-1-phosphate guanylyltransferase/mannose-6-phosphate isomerase [Alphaproteobacteria bacterium]